MRTAVPEDTSKPDTIRREYVLTVAGPIRETINRLARRYQLYTDEGAPRDAEIIRVLLVCALTRNRSPREQAAIALYVNGLMFVTQGLWLGLYEVRDDIAETMKTVVRAKVGKPVREPKPTKTGNGGTRDQSHVKIDDWIRMQLEAVLQDFEKDSENGKDENPYKKKNGSYRDGRLVADLVATVTAEPQFYEKAFALYVLGMAQVRESLLGGLESVRDTLRRAIVDAAGAS